MPKSIVFCNDIAGFLSENATNLMNLSQCYKYVHIYNA